MNYQYAGSLYPTSGQMHEAIAVDWLTGGGKNAVAYVIETFRTVTDNELADEVLNEWVFDDDSGVDRWTLVRAFGKVRAHFLTEPKS